MTDKFQAPEAGPMAWFFKERIAPLNATILFSSTVSGVVDFAFGRAALWLELCALACVLLLLFVLSVSLLPAGAGLPATRRLWATVRAAARGLRKGGMLLYLLAATTVFGSAAYASEQHRAQGGVLASTFPDLAALQQKLDLLHHDNQQMLQTMAGLKQETSSNPRKELANQGIAWNKNNFLAAVRDQDVQAAALFLQGGMPIDIGPVQLAFEGGNAAMQQLFIGASQELGGTDCSGLMMYLKTDLMAAADARQRALLAKACGSTAGRAALATVVREQRENTAAMAAERARLRLWVGTPEHCQAAVLAGHGPELRIIHNLGTLLDERNGAWEEQRPAAAAHCQRVLETIAAYLPYDGISNNATLVQQWMQ